MHPGDNHIFVVEGSVMSIPAQAVSRISTGARRRHGVPCLFVVAAYKVAGYACRD